MPRNHNPGPSTLRNRNRVTNKTRLRVIQGNIDADPVAFDEDEEKARVISTAGVDAEDANEHHLQAVLSAASRHNAAVQRTTRGASDKAAKQQDAYIPIPDYAGLVDDYDQSYPPDRWKDPFSYIKTSETVEEAIADSLANGFTYFMDERDEEWLEKNNEEARGEGTSAQGALSGAGTRFSQRSAKAKGKEPDVPQATVMSEDQFELVMGLFEKVTHEKTEFLHHGLEQGAPFPPFSDYQDTFSSPLGPDVFTAFSVPAWIPQPPQIVRFAKVVYPYWKERRLERGGHRIIPVLNFDESDVLNESYICFRRRDVKAMRKTRASQASSSEKLIRLQAELLNSYELVNNMVNRELMKRESALQALAVWEKREDLVNLKRKFTSLGVKEDDELFYDKERVPKKPRVVESTGRIPLKLRTRDNGEMAASAHAEAIIRPKERLASIQSSIDREMLRIRERDHHWEDGIDNAYQPQPVPFAQRHWKFIPPESSSTSRSSPLDSDEEQAPQPWRAVHSQEILWRIRDRWKFDSDDEPPVGPEGADEQDRVLVDEFDVGRLKKSMTFYHGDDHNRLSTDSTIYVPLPDGRVQPVLPFRLGALQMPRGGRSMPPPQSAQMAAMQAQAQAQQASLALSMPQTSGTPISMQAQIKKMQPLVNVPQVRLSSNGGMRPPATPNVAPLHSDPQNTQVSPPNPATQTLVVNGHSGAAHHATNGNDIESRPASAASITQGQEAVAGASESPVATPANPPMQLKPPNPHHAMNMPNGYHMNSYSPSMPNAAAYLHANMPHGPLSIQQMQSLKSAFAGQDMTMQVNGNRPAAYMGHVIPNGANYNLPLGVNVGQNMSMGMNLKLPTSRQVQWASAQQGQRQAHLTPPQSRASPSVAIAHSLSPHLHSASPTMPSQQVQVQVSPSRPGQTPASSPSIQQQQQQAAVGGSGGY
ncbi:hypothetical protein EW146_g8143 [Bondarzewia mesenterica]|uniref:Enhancer of polycomb-like protein n=1 Tax=Bondarzewia mesenterica TaxID=1095465 RepID=A0A4S4LII7_9AGAM|nr:hypothetical protein EW146_g8143 [Bondarzewia mesenterica]